MTGGPSWAARFVPPTLISICWLALPVGAAEIRLREVAEEWGLAFRQHHAGSGQRFMVETMGNGLVLFDFDHDGDVDVFFIDSAPLPGYQGETPRSRLFRNEGSGRFLDLSDRAGIEVRSYAQGGTAGDVDGDGDLDLYLTALGVNELWRNDGDGTFTNIAAEAGVDDPLWGTSAAFADVDRDGDLDLYVANYVAFTVEDHRSCVTLGREVYCHPGAYGGSPDRFFRNRGDGSFEEATRAVGLETPDARAGLGVVFGDLDDDGWPDLYVANDAEPNCLFRNRGDGTFSETALLAGTAYSERGRPEAGMGVDMGDVDGDGRFDIMVTNFELETNALYLNQGAGIFIDGRYAFNVAESSLLNLAFGVALADLDHDADVDLVIANGHILDNAHELNQNSRYAQVNQVLVNSGRGRFEEQRTAGFELVRVSRGLATGDLDGDGDLDVAISNSNDVAEVYQNLIGTDGGHWLQVDLTGERANRFGVGTRVTVTAGGARQIRERRSASSYMSQNSLTLHFGLAAATQIEQLEVGWPSGTRQRFAGLPADRHFRLWE
jgi:hypothetical protein